MNKLIYIFVLLLGCTTASIAQQHRYAWKIGLHAGLSNYYGDLSHQAWDLPHQFDQPIQDFNFLSYGLSVEYHVSRSFGLRLFGMKSQFKASDRTYDNSSTYNRALNVQTDLFDASLLGILYFDNDRVFNSKAAFAPYVLFGGGITHFETKGDLLSSDNDRYYYWSDNTIRTQDENGVNAATAQIIEQDYQYETDLRPLSTEGVDYNPITWNVALGLGLKFRLSKRFHLHLEALVRYTGTDYLDDVSADYRTSYNDNFQAYAANPSGVNRATRGASPEMNDWYTFVGLSAHYSFGQKSYAIRPSIIYTESLLLSSNTTQTTTPDNSNKVTPSSSTNSNTPSADTVVQKIITTTTTIKTTTVDTSNTSSSITPKTSFTESLKVEPVVSNKVTKPTVTTFLEDSIRPINPPVVAETYKVDSTRLAVDAVSQQELPLTKADSLLNDSVRTLVNVPDASNYRIDYTRIEVDSVPKIKTIKPVVTTVVNTPINPVPSPSVNPSPRLRDSIIIQNSITNITNAADVEKIRLLELQQQEQKYQYELLLQKERYDRQLAELGLQKKLEQEQKKSAPNTKEQELQYELKLEQQKHANELAQQKLLNQLELEKNRPAPDNKQEELKSQQQKYEADLKLQQQEYEYKLQIQALQNQLKLEQLKKVNEGTGSINKPAPSNNQPTKELRNLTIPISPQISSTNNADTTIIINDINIQSNPRSEAENAAYLEAIKATEQALRQQQEALEAKEKALAKMEATAKDTIRIVQTDSIFLDNGNNSELTKRLNQQQSANNSLATQLAVAQKNSLDQQREIENLQSKITTIELENKSVSNELDVFLSQKKGTYVTKIYFDIGKSSLTVQAKETLTTLVYYLEKYPKVQFWVKGFASKTGRTELNERLSAERAVEVADFLKQSGIQGERLRTTPLGELDSTNRDELDRRAEVHLSF